MTDSRTDTGFGILSRSRVFQSIPSSELERLAPRCTCTRFRRGEEILRFGDPGDALCVVGRGRVKATLPAPDANGEFIVGLLWPGDVFGEIVVFDQQTRAGNAIAITEADVLFVPRVELLALLERRPAVALRLIEGLCEKLRTAVELSLSIRYLDVPSRLYRRIAYLARFDSRWEEGGLRIPHGLSQRELADTIGSSREVLNKVLIDWKRAGLLDYGRGYLVVRDPTALGQRLPPAVRRGPAMTASVPLPDAVAAPTALSKQR